MTKFETLYLHVGLPKTGTTSIQRGLYRNRARLQELDYFFPESFAVGLNILLAAMFHPDPSTRPQFQFAIDKRGGSQQALREHMARLLDEELENVTASNLILSSEFLAAQSELGDVRQYCVSLASRTKVILYLRDPVALTLSLHSTFMRAGGNEFPTYRALERGQFLSIRDAKRVVMGLEEHFAREDITVRIFSRDHLRNGSAVDDFLTAVGLGDHVDDFPVPRENVSLSLPAVEVLSRVNPHFPPIVDGAQNRGRQRLLKQINQLDQAGDFGKAALPAGFSEIIREQTAEGNEWVRQNYFPELETLFGEPVAEADATAAEGDDPLDYAAQLLVASYSRVAELEAELKAMQEQAALEAQAEPEVTEPEITEPEIAEPASEPEAPGISQA